MQNYIDIVKFNEFLDWLCCWRHACYWMPFSFICTVFAEADSCCCVWFSKFCSWGWIVWLMIHNKCKLDGRQQLMQYRSSSCDLQFTCNIRNWEYGNWLGIAELCKLPICDIICKVLLLNFTSRSNWSMLVAVTWVAHDLWFLLQAVVTRGGRFLEAPVIGSKQLAKDGQLVVVVAGDKSLYDDCQSCLQAMARHIFYLGLLLFMLRLCVQSNLPK